MMAMMQTKRPAMTDEGWSRPFDDPIPFPVVAARHAQGCRQPKAEQNLEEWQTAGEISIKAAPPAGRQPAPPIRPFDPAGT
jgi:hypothetical protein